MSYLFGEMIVVIAILTVVTVYFALCNAYLSKKDKDNDVDM